MSQVRRKRRRSWSSPVIELIRELTLRGHTPRQIAGQVRRSLPDEDAPSERTIYDLQREMRPAAGPGWRMATADPDDAALILPVLGAVTRNSDGRIGHFTNQTASWIARIRRVAPALDPIATYRWAVRYQSTTTAGRDTGDLDRELARDTEKPPRPGEPERGG